MNLPNLLTILRVIMTFVAVVLLCIDIRFFALASFIIYCAAGATDWFDGYLARKYNIVTTFGKFMDALSDKIMVVSMFMALFAFNLYSWFTVPALFCAIVSITREFYVSGIRMLASKEGIVMAAETLGKYKAAFQMYSIGAILCAHSLDIDFGAGNSLFFNFAFYSGIATLVISTALSILSGYSYGSRYSYLLK
ncbi:cDP-diacylglycerol--glycerol-3-phosphate 3-phosphatidyltransferase [Coraliomargarita sp. CAG:312]|nr:cDP-diacylglycerol--glycerol-3-phosphate 3-phosphatidyltransferase [Coraliomargarita sp. CAG:312]